jgi:hypothetical protein
MKKSVITIEKEFFEDENGIPMVRRIVKEDDILIYDHTTEVSDAEDGISKLSIFDRWIKYIKTPAELRPKLSSSVSNKSNEIESVDIEDDPLEDYIP